MAQVDFNGNVNVSKFNGRFPGAGGLINISQNAKSLFFVGAFTAHGLEIEIVDGLLQIKTEGAFRKFVSSVDHLSFSGARAVRCRQSVAYITERCVFRFAGAGLTLTEVARGIDVDRDILAHMDFAPLIGPLAYLPDAIFGGALMHLRHHLLPPHPHAMDAAA